MVTEKSILDGCATRLADIEHPVVIDVGAYIGNTVDMWLRAAPGARVYAFEPDVDNYMLLADRFGNDERVQCLNVAVWCWDGYARLYSANHKGSAGSSQGNSMYESMMRGKKWAQRVANTQVRCVMLDSFMDGYGIERVDLLKLNAEGAEYALFDGPARFVDRSDMVYISMHGKCDEFLSDGYKAKRRQIVARLEGSGLRMTEGVTESIKHMPQLWVR